MTFCDVTYTHRLTPYRLYFDADLLTDEIKEHLCVGSEGGVATRDYSAIWDDVKSLTDSEGKIWVG